MPHGPRGQPGERRPRAARPASLSGVRPDARSSHNGTCFAKTTHTARGRYIMDSARSGLGGVMSGSVSTSGRRHVASAGAAEPVRVGWTSGYLRVAVVVDGLCALVAGLVALEVRFDGGGSVPAEYL